jgi:hypothetical protein
VFHCESNLLGIVNGKGNNVGSGGWTNIIEKYLKAKQYGDAPFEIRHQGGRNVRTLIPGEWLGAWMPGRPPRHIGLQCHSATDVDWQPQSLDAVCTDPPYFGNVQYGELMDFCYVWLRRLVGTQAAGFWRESTRVLEELTGNTTQGRGLTHFTAGLSEVYQRVARALKPGAPLAFTYHHNTQEAYGAIAVALLDAGFTCSAALPCPAEMGGSIHIHGTASSIVDTVFVCRVSGCTLRRWLVENADDFAQLVAEDLDHLRTGGLTPTAGDVRCLVYGHATRMAIWHLRLHWDRRATVTHKLAQVAHALQAFGDLAALSAQALQTRPSDAHFGPLFARRHTPERDADVVAF